MAKCTKCGSRDIDFQEAGGQSICVNCGTILEEDAIVSSIEFQVFFIFSPNNNFPQLFILYILFPP